MRIELNGQVRELPAASSLEDAVRESGADRALRGLAVALEGEVVPRNRWQPTSSPRVSGSRSSPRSRVELMAGSLGAASGPRD